MGISWGVISGFAEAAKQDRLLREEREEKRRILEEERAWREGESQKDRDFRAKQNLTNILSERQMVLGKLIAEQRAEQAAAEAELAPYYDYFSKKGVDPAYLRGFSTDTLQEYHDIIEDPETGDMSTGDIIKFMQINTERPPEERNQPGAIQIDLSSARSGTIDGFDPVADFLPGVGWDTLYDLQAPRVKRGTGLASSDYSGMPLSEEDTERGVELFDGIMLRLFNREFANNPEDSELQTIRGLIDGKEDYTPLLEQRYGRLAKDILLSNSPQQERNKLLPVYEPSLDEQEDEEIVVPKTTTEPPTVTPTTDETAVQPDVTKLQDDITQLADMIPDEEEGVDPSKRGSRRDRRKGQTTRQFKLDNPDTGYDSYDDKTIELLIKSLVEIGELEIGDRWKLGSRSGWVEAG